MTLTDTRLHVHRIGGRIGAQISGVDLAAPLDGDTISAINTALLRHKALFFREQQLDDEAQVRFAASLGQLTTAHPTVPALAGSDHILAVDGGEGARANNWHTDVTFVLSPPKATTLRSLVVPEYGGDTLIANTATAYTDLPEPLRRLADGLQAVHSNDYDYIPHPQFGTEEAEQRREVFVSTRYQTVHPVVRVHPETGEPNLFIGGFAQQLIGLSRTESRDLLRLLQSYVTRPENVVRWRWAPGDLVLFDNRTTQHYAVDDYGDLPRRLHRVTVAGDVPVGLDGRPSYVVEGDAATHYTPTPQDA
ncbi:TauD/TfdA family dioxygenase [Micromonospora zingiberis]|uniref:Alpha-ketoglutarate-dependent sulfate ester dioxygenase n=1 Tax=Micromonospora zingiberis TaxID=2053011 RepID=A0A4R0GKE7_9ACTN|nr:TauD/TfdA family dioxygenase [Micromonospora zingiberis]TCB96843.1 TauD/TfdA family dioxygenase [Micromonospora zingiberis]